MLKDTSASLTSLMDHQGEMKGPARARCLARLRLRVSSSCYPGSPQGELYPGELQLHHQWTYSAESDEPSCRIDLESRYLTDKSKRKQSYGPVWSITSGLMVNL